jgi:hypothetical protein
VWSGIAGFLLAGNIGALGCGSHSSGVHGVMGFMASWATGGYVRLISRHPRQWSLLGMSIKHSCVTVRMEWWVSGTSIRRGWKTRCQASGSHGL